MNAIIHAHMLTQGWDSDQHGYSLSRDTKKKDSKLSAASTLQI